MAPAAPTTLPGAKAWAMDSNRTIATRNLAEKCEHRLFLSATPHNGFTESFTALMEMIDNRRFQRGALLDEKALRDIAVRRLKSDVPEKGFKQRELKSLPFEPDKDEEEHFATLNRILTASARANKQAKAGGIVSMLFKKRLLSSPWSFAQTLREYTGAEGGRGLEFDDEDDYYQEVLGSGQSDGEEGDTDHSEFTALRQSKRSDPLVAATQGDIQALPRAQARLHRRLGPATQLAAADRRRHLRAHRARTRGRVEQPCHLPRHRPWPGDLPGSANAMAPGGRVPGQVMPTSGSGELHAVAFRSARLASAYRWPRRSLTMKDGGAR